VRHLMKAVPARAGMVTGLALLAVLAGAVQASAAITASRSGAGTKILIIGSTPSGQATFTRAGLTLTLAPTVKTSQVKVAGGCGFTPSTKKISCRFKNGTKPAQQVITFSAVAAPSSSLVVGSSTFRGRLKFVGGPGPDRLDVRRPRFPLQTITFLGAGGNDTMRLHPSKVSALTTSVKGGAGRDRLLGSFGVGIPPPPGGVFGFSGADTIDGGTGNDTIDGRNGPDKIIGGTGVDTISTNGQGVRIETIDGELDTVNCGGILATAWFGDATDTGTACPKPVPELPEAPH